MRPRYLIIFVLLFLTINLLTSFLATKYIPYLGFFPYGELIKQYNLPSFISSFANFDGAHYLSIAKSGYYQYEQAYFPLYPLLIKFFSPLFKNNLLITGLVVSNICFFMGLIFCYKFLKKTLKENEIDWFFIFLFLFPTSFFFSAVYTEGLFFLLIVACFYFLQKKNYLLVFFLAFLASTTRIIGILLIIPIFFHFYSQKQKIKLRLKHLLIFLSPLIGLVTYSIYLFKTTRDPLFFLNSQPVFGAHRSTNIILLPQVYYRYLKIFLTAQWNSQYFVSTIEFVFFSFVFIILILDLISNFKLKILNYNKLGLSLFSLAALILPTLTGTFSSIPRYALFSFSFFLVLARIKNVYLKIFITSIFFILHTVLLALFIQGYFVS